MNQGSRNRQSGCGGVGSATDTHRFPKTAQKLDADATAVRGVSLDRIADLRYPLSRNREMNKHPFVEGLVNSYRMVNRANIDASRALHTADWLSLVEASNRMGRLFRKPHTRTSSPTNCLLSANMLTLHLIKKPLMLTELLRML